MKVNVITLVLSLAATMTTAAAVPDVDTGNATTIVVGGQRGEARCETSGRSPGVSNIAVGANELRDKGNDSCYHDGGSKTQMVHRNGIRIYLMGRAGSAPCRVAADKLATLMAECAAEVDGDIRAGGTIDLIPGTYIQVSQ
ncbi:hypothetical protein EJ08DRAFT_698669 [Tothia fuscella]|uniref:Uncharacterized protein n=1 Tax=Tothia fuscella TaxID=1048955 RepID=A0A9P4NPF9_9PEZI|nr:hypothetical protein EJ08DRAFT_698669 [Tothia fuscella]